MVRLIVEEEHADSADTFVTETESYVGVWREKSVQQVKHTFSPFRSIFHPVFLVSVIRYCQRKSHNYRSFILVSDYTISARV